MNKMKIYLLLTFNVLLLICPSTPKMSAKTLEAVLQGIDIADEKVKNLRDSLSQNNHLTTEDIFVACLETLPLIGPIVDILANGDINTQKLILGKLNLLLEGHNDVMRALLTLQKKIESIVTDNHITISTKSITSCSDDLKAFFRNPNQIPEQNLMINWYFNIMTDIRFLVRILTEKETSLPKFFQTMIQADGFCNSSKIINSYKYLLGYVIVGCQSAIIAEQLKYNGSSALFLQECKSGIASSKQHLGSIFRKCARNSCEKIGESLKGHIQPSSARDTDRLLTEISDELPWFTFSVLAFASKPKQLQITGNLLPGYNAFKAKDFYIYIMWTQLETNGAGVWGDRFTGFALQFNTDNFTNASFAMNVNKNIYSNPGYIISFIANDSLSTYKPCANSEVILNVSSGINEIAPAMLFMIFLILITVNMY